jgi:hypothetical protein
VNNYGTARRSNIGRFRKKGTAVCGSVKKNNLLEAKLGSKVQIWRMGFYLQFPIVLSTIIQSALKELSQ